MGLFDRHKENVIVKGIPIDTLESRIQNIRSTGRMTDEDTVILAHNFIDAFSKSRATLVNATSREQFDVEVMKKSLRNFVIERTPYLMEDSQNKLLKYIFDYIWGFGILQPEIERDGMSDLRIVSWNNVRIKVGATRMSSPVKFRSPEHLNQFVEFLCVRNQVTLNRNNAIIRFVDDNISDKYKLRIDITDSSVNSVPNEYVHIRFLPKEKKTFPDLIKLGMLGPKIYNYLVERYQAGCSILVCGKNGSGKTYVMNALLELTPHDKSCMVAQETNELFCESHPEMVFHLVVPKSPDATTEYNLRTFTQHALVNDIDYLYIGEIKGPEAFDMVNGCYTGQVCVTSMHSDSSIEAPDKIVHYMKYVSDLPKPELLRMLSGMDIILFMKDFHMQEITEIAGFDEDAGRLMMHKMFEFQVREDANGIKGVFAQLNKNSCEKVEKKLKYARYKRAVS